MEPLLHLRILFLFLSFSIITIITNVGADEEQIVIDTTEYAALRVIRNSLNDQPGSTFFSTWDFKLDPCTAFRGVVCAPGDDGSSTRHVVMLSLGSGFAGSPGLSGRLSPALGNFPYLRILTLVPGSVHGDIPTEIGSLRRLQFLGLSNNLLSGSIPASLSSLTSLRGLDLSSNKLSGVVPPGSLPPTIDAPSLSRLSIHRNQLTGTLPSRIPPSLVHLDLSRNAISGSIPATTFTIGFSNVVFLDLSFNSLTGPVPATLLGLPSLGQVLLQRNSLSGELSPTAPVSFDRLDVSHNAITGAPSPLLATVRELVLNNNKMSGKVPAEIVAGLLVGEMRSLYLQHNFLSGIQNIGVLGGAIGSFCIQYNCMVPPSSSACPSSSGKAPVRPSFQCANIQGDWN